MFEDLALRRQIRFMQVHLVWLKHTEETTLRLWYGEATPNYSVTEATQTWQPNRECETLLGHKARLWFWQKMMTLEQFGQWLEALRHDNVIRTDTAAIPVAFVERPMVFLPNVVESSPLRPNPDESAWLCEFWDDEKRVRTLLAPDLVTKANRAVKDELGIDLDYWLDRVGNLAIFLPTGVKTQWNFDAVSGAAVVQTNLQPDELGGYSLDLELWDEEETSYRRHVPLTKPSMIFDGIQQFRSVKIAVFRDGHLIHEEGKLPLLKSIMMTAHFGQQKLQRQGKEYSYAEDATKSIVGETVEPVWVRLSRERRALNAKADLEQALKFKFYEPDTTGVARKQALADVTTILNRATQSVRIWDAYFGTQERIRQQAEQDTAGKVDPVKENFDLLETVTNLSVPVQVLLSCDDWQRGRSEYPTIPPPPCGVSNTLEAVGQELVKRRTDFPERFNNVYIKAWVRKDETTFHDRFIIVDSKHVWALGSSLSGMGKKHTTLFQVDYGDQIVTAFDSIWHTAGEAQPGNLWGRVVEVPCGV